MTDEPKPPKPRLSSMCRCGPKGNAIHEMGKCPKLFEPDATPSEPQPPKKKKEKSSGNE